MRNEGDILEGSAVDVFRKRSQKGGNFVGGRHKDGINDMNHTIGCQHIGFCNCRIVDLDGIVRGGDRDPAALQRNHSLGVP